MYRSLSILAILTLSIAWVAPGDQPRPTTRRVWSGGDVNLLGGPSPDGELLSFVDPATGDLAVYELESGKTRRLTRNPAEAETFAYFSVVSRDASRIAYAWFNEKGFYELWTVGVNGGEPRRLYSNPETGFVQPCDWSLDGSQILTLFFRKDNVSQIALVSAEDGSVRILKTLSWFYPKKVSFSPDGRFILYDSIMARDEVARDILLLNADGSAERTLIEHEANDIFPLWAPAGDGVVFASDRSGDMDLWLAPVRDGNLAGEPTRIARSVGRALPMGVTRDGTYFYGLRAGRSDVLTASFEGGRIGEPTVAGNRTVGRSTAPAWSRDGSRIAYLTQLGTENYGRESRGLAIWNPSTRQERVLVPRLAYIAQVHWSPDDSRLLASGSDGRGRSGLFTVDPQTGAVRGLVRVHGGGPRGLEGVWLDAESIVHVAPDRARVLALDLESREQRILFKAAGGDQIRWLSAFDQGRWIAFGLGSDESVTEVRALDLESGRDRRLFQLDQGTVSALESLEDQLYVTTRDAEGVTVWKVGLDGQAPQRTALEVGPGGPRFSPDGRRVAYGRNDQRSEVWALEGWLPAAPEPRPAASESLNGGP